MERPIPDPTPPVFVSKTVRNQLRGLSRLFLDRARSAVSTRDASSYGQRLRYGQRGLQGVSELAEIQLTAEGDVAEVSCAICHRVYPFANWPHGCIHTAGLVLRAVEGSLSVGGSAEQHPMLSRTSKQLQYRLRRTGNLDLWQLPAHHLARRYDGREFPGPKRWARC